LAKSPNVRDVINDGVTNAEPADPPLDPGALEWGRRLYRELQEKDRRCLLHHVKNKTLAMYLTARGTTANIAFKRLTLPGGIDAKAADKEVAETYINVPPDTDPLDGGADRELRPLLAEWEKGQGRPFVSPPRPKP